MRSSATELIHQVRSHFKIDSRPIDSTPQRRPPFEPRPDTLLSPQDGNGLRFARPNKTERRIMNRWKRFLADENGPTMVEYTLLLAMIVLVSVSTLGGFGVGMRNIYVIISGALPT